MTTSEQNQTCAASPKHTPGPWAVRRLSHAHGDLWLQVGHVSGLGPIARTASIAEPMPGAVAEMKYLVTDPDEQWANARLIAASPQGLQAAENAYLWLLKSVCPGSMLRFSAQPILCELRDYIVAATGRDAQDVQEDFEERATIALATQQD